MKHPYEMRFRDVVDILRRRRRFIVRVWAIGIALGAATSLAVQPKYRAGATITADKIPPVILLDQALGGQNVATPEGMASPDIPTLVALATSEQVQAGAIAQLDSTKRERAIKTSLRAGQYKSTQYVRITVDDTVPGIAAEAANAVAASLIENDLNARRQWAKDTRISIQQQLTVVDPKLRAAEDDLVAFKGRYGDVPMSDSTVVTLNRLAQMEAQLVDVRLQEQEARARLDTARTRMAGQAQVVPTQWRPSPLISTLQTQLANEEIELSGLRQMFTPKHPQVMDVSAKIEETKQKLNAELAHSLHIDQYGVDPVYQQLAQQMHQDEVSTAALAARDRALGTAIDQYETTVRRLPGRELDQARLQRNVKETEAIHQVLTGKLQQALVAEASIGSAIRVVDEATPPAAPVRPRYFGLLMGTLLGLVLGLGGALLTEQIEDPLKSVDHGKHALGTPALGTIPSAAPERGDPRRRAAAVGAPDRSCRLPVPIRVPWGRSGGACERARSAFAESFRHLRTNLLCLDKQLPRTLLVTSAAANDGKDIVATNLAIAFAHAGMRVWLVDCDLRKPTLGRAPILQSAGETSPYGIAEILSRGISERCVMRDTTVANLRFLPAGARPSNPAELVGSGRMRAFLQEEREDVDVIVLTAPPVLPVTDAAVLARSVEGVLLVARLGQTPREAAQRARQHLDEVGARVLGTVFTGAPAEALGAYFTYYERDIQTEPSGMWYYGPHRARMPRPDVGAALAALRRALRRAH